MMEYSTLKNKKKITPGSGFCKRKRATREMTEKNYYCYVEDIV